ncbi:MAG: energy-coupling factor transporter ATPase [Eggerthellaceae bacterium]|nr:energy-coupling factor transporter ATPase [Eggerthellaceae bacterium]
MSLALREAGVPVAVHAAEGDLVTELEALFATNGADGSSLRSGQLPPKRTVSSTDSDEHPLCAESASAEGEDPDASSSVVGACHLERQRRISDVSGAQDPSCSDLPKALIEFQDVGFTYHHASARKRARKRGKQESKADWGNSPDAMWALRNVSFALHEGEFFGIAGHTGSGKSTLIQHMNGLLGPTEGRVLVGGRPVAGPDVAAREGVGMVFQYPEHQLFAATVYEDVTFGPRNLGCSIEEMQQRYERAMNRVDLDAEALRDASPFDLSGGQQRRVAFAGVLAMEPTTLVLDEPTAGLDPQAHEDFLQLIWRLHRQLGITVVMVSHNMDDLARYCSRILVLNQGTMHALGTPVDVFSDGVQLKSIGLGQPAAQRLGSSLVAEGIPIQQPEGLFTLETLVDAISVAWKPVQQ